MRETIDKNVRLKWQIERLEQCNRKNNIIINEKYRQKKKERKY